MNHTLEALKQDAARYRMVKSKKWMEPGLEATIDAAIASQALEAVPAAVPARYWMDDKALEVARQFTSDTDGRGRAALQCAVIEAMQFAIGQPPAVPVVPAQALQTALDAAMGVLVQIADTPRNKGARQQAYAASVFLKTQLDSAAHGITGAPS